jgi:hypothetical protein
VRFLPAMRPAARAFALAFWLAAACAPASADDGLKLTYRGSSSGIDPSFAPTWLNPERDRLGFASYHWRDSVGFAPTARMQWAYALGHSSLGMSVVSGKDFDAAPVYGAEARQYGLFGRYSLAPDWSLSAETVSRDPSVLFRLQDLRIGVRRQF